MELNLGSINEMLSSILTTDINRSDSSVDRYFTEDAIFVHPLFEVKGRHEIKRLSTMWCRSCIAITMTPGATQLWITKEAAADDCTGPVIAIDVRYDPRPLFNPFKVSPVRIFVLLHLIKLTPVTGPVLYKIHRQEDFNNTAGLVGAVAPAPFDPLFFVGAQVALRVSGLYNIYVLHPLLFLLRTFVVDPIVLLFGGQDRLTSLAQVVFMPVFLVLEVLGGRGASTFMRSAMTFTQTKPRG